MRRASRLRKSLKNKQGWCKRFGYALLFLPQFVFAQQNWLPLHQDFKDHLYRTELNKQLSSLHPVSEGQINLHYLIRDSSKQYYDLTQKLFKEHLLEVSDTDYSLSISPLLDISLGSRFGDTTSTRYFNNTRGYLMELDLGTKVSFSSMYFENQNRFLPYYDNYVRNRGERYPRPDSTYIVDNGVVPGAARTKPFKTGAFDYGYAIGNVVYAPNKKWRVSLGNQQMFVGYGHRSLFLSDHSVPNIHLRNDIHISPKLQYSFARARSLNLLRRPNRTTVEAFYEQKPYGFHYLHYQPTEDFSINIFEGIIWSVGDSVSSTALPVDFYLPVPFATVGLSNRSGQSFTVLGMEMVYRYRKALFYTQLSAQPYRRDKFAGQLGMRLSNAFGMQESFLQVEFNSVPYGVYEAANPRLSFSAYHLSLAHPLESGFNEYLLRYNREFKRFYASIQGNYYEFYNHRPGSLLPVYDQINPIKGSRFVLQTEAGIHVNRKVNLRLFVKHLYRNDMIGSTRNVTSAMFFGLSTRLFNRYEAL